MDKDMSIEWEPVYCCPICGWGGIPSVENLDMEINEVIHVYYCMRCHCSYQNPRMSMKSIEEYYGSGTYRSHKTRSYTAELHGQKKQAAFVKLFFLEAFRRDMKVDIKRALDYGCGRGLMVKGIQDKYGCETIGFDLYRDPDAVIDIVDSKDKITGKFDLITCVHVLEHLQRPIEELDWMVSMLSENGIIFIEIPFSRLVFPPHPIMFSRDSVFRLMNHINARYMFYDTQYLNENGLIFAQPNNPDDFSLQEDIDKGVIGYFRESEKKNDVMDCQEVDLGKEFESL